MSDEPRPSSPSAHWQRRRTKTAPIPRDEAIRQGDITRLAFLTLGRDGAINFLNAENKHLGGRPIAVATQSADGEAAVRAELARLVDADTLSPPHSTLKEQ
jgi:hypothetical protein